MFLIQNSHHISIFAFAPKHWQKSKRTSKSISIGTRSRSDTEKPCPLCPALAIVQKIMDLTIEDNIT
jgi:hypothetical protein